MPYARGSRCRTGRVFGVGALLLVCLSSTSPWMQGCSRGTAPAEKAPRPIGHILAVDPVIVNVFGTNGTRYLKTTVAVEVLDNEKKVKEVEERKSQILDVLVSDLRKRTLAEVTAPDALGTIRADLLAEVRQALGAELVQQLLVTEFVVQ
jgi:flagellar basal body-associated protein FliL